MKYMGSKNRISKDIVPIIQSYIDKNNAKYFEPFCGGCNVIDKIDCNIKYASDAHLYLIALLKNLSRLEELPKFITKEHYSDVRNCYNNNDNRYDDWYVGAIGFLASYNGRFFDGGYAGLVKTKIGTERNYYEEALNNLLTQRDNLSGIRFHHKSFADTNKNISNYVIYCDPPYKDTKQYSISKNFCYETFYDWCRKLSKNNIVLCSEYWMPDDFECIWSQEILTSMDNNRNANDDKNKRVEKLFICK